MNRTWLAAIVCLAATTSLADETAAPQPGVRPRGVPLGSARTNMAEDDVLPASE